MTPLAGRIPYPPAVEFVARCILATRRSVLPLSSGARGQRGGAGGQSGSAQDLRPALNALGVRPGDALMVHSDAGAVQALGWAPSDLIDHLLEYLGSAGTLLMPSHPKLYRIERGEAYDPRRSPSTVGLLTELFRRRPSVVRSLYPVSSVSALGALQHDLTEGHRRSFAPHDELSPYARLAEAGGKVLCVGCAADRMTILHVAEDVLRGELGIESFYSVRDVELRTGSGVEAILVHERAPWLWWYLAMKRWSYDVYRRGLVKDLAVDGTELRVASAPAVVGWMKEEVRLGRSLYPLAGLNRWLRLGTPAFLGQERHEA